MKPVPLFLLAIILLPSCEKENYDSPKSIIGEWQWVKSCGGFTGGCWYPSENHKERAIFTANNKYLRYSNDDKVFECNFKLGSVKEVDEVKYFEISFISSEGKTNSHEWSTEFWFTDGRYLNIPGGDFIEEFKRIK